MNGQESDFLLRHRLLQFPAHITAHFLRHLACSGIIAEYKIKEKLNFLIGTDAFEKIDSWYKADEIKPLVHFIVFPRGVKLSDKSGWDYEMAPLKFLDVSSTDIRKSHNETIKEVKEYIEKNDLYV